MKRAAESPERVIEAKIGGVCLKTFAFQPNEIRLEFRENKNFAEIRLAVMFLHRKYKSQKEFLERYDSALRVSVKLKLLGQTLEFFGYPEGCRTGSRDIGGGPIIEHMTWLLRPNPQRLRSKQEKRREDLE